MVSNAGRKKPSFSKIIHCTHYEGLNLTCVSQQFLIQSDTNFLVGVPTSIDIEYKTKGFSCLFSLVDSDFHSSYKTKVINIKYTLFYRRFLA